MSLMRLLFYKFLIEFLVFTMHHAFHILLSVDIPRFVNIKNNLANGNTVFICIIINARPLQQLRLKGE